MKLLRSLFLAFSLLFIASHPSNAVETVKVLAQAAPQAAAASVTISNASPAVVTWTNHGLAVGDMVVFTTTGALPTGLTVGQTYFVISAGLTSNAFEVSATAGGTAINTSSAGSGTHTATSYRVVYTVPASTSTVVSTMVLANTSTISNDIVKIAIHPACAALASKMFIVPGTTVNYGDSLLLTLGITLAASDCVTMNSANGTTSLNMFGSEVQ